MFGAVDYSKAAKKQQQIDLVQCELIAALQGFVKHSD
jgi:hypothetical protein